MVSVLFFLGNVEHLLFASSDTTGAVSSSLFVLLAEKEKCDIRQIQVELMFPYDRLRFLYSRNTSVVHVLVHTTLMIVVVTELRSTRESKLSMLWPPGIFLLPPLYENNVKLSHVL